MAACYQHDASRALPASDYYPVLQSTIHMDWQKRWDEGPQNFLRGYKPHIRPWPSSSQPNRRFETALVCLRVGHTRLTHGYLMAREAAPICSCDSPLTVSHILIHCPNYADVRRRCFLRYCPTGTPLSIALILGDPSPIPVQEICSFLSQTQILNKL